MIDDTFLYDLSDHNKNNSYLLFGGCQVKVPQLISRNVNYVELFPRSLILAYFMVIE